MVGKRDGNKLGRKLVGKVLGNDVFKLLGLSDDRADGINVEASLGLIDGKLDGNLLSTFEGFIEGRHEGILDG